MNHRQSKNAFVAMKAGSLCLFFAGLFSGCDPARRIEMKNRTDDSVTFVWTSLEDSIGYNPFIISNARELTLSVPPHKEIRMSFGIGTWSPLRVQQIISKLASFEILSSNQRIKIDSLELLKDFLLARRKGIGGSK